jgi:hypothetical protein
MLFLIKEEKYKERINLVLCTRNFKSHTIRNRTLHFFKERNFITRG